VHLIVESARRRAARLRTKGIDCDLLHDDMTQQERDALLDDLATVAPNTRILYATSSVVKDHLERIFKAETLAALVVDDDDGATAKSEHLGAISRLADLRPEPLHDVPLIFLTGITTPAAREELTKKLKFREPKVNVMIRRTM
jgi:superfamily II DNA helicase RecQ